MKRLPRLTRPDIAALALIAALLLVPFPAAAQVPAQGTVEATDEDPALTKKEEKERAKEARIAEYLRKREERRARQDLRKDEKAELRARQEGTSLETPQDDSRSPAVARSTRKPGKRLSLPRDVERIHREMRVRTLGQDPTVQGYMDLVESGEASPYQLAAFGNFLSQNGMSREGIVYYGMALGMVKDDPVLWMNVGTMHRQLGELPVAAAAYARALGIDSNNAYAHYNLGAVLDEMGEYDESIEEYKLALSLDPTLGDPVYNPQAATNERLIAVKLMLYKEQSGSLGLPLIDLPEGDLDPEKLVPRPPVAGRPTLD